MGYRLSTDQQIFNRFFVYGKKIGERKIRLPLWIIWALLASFGYNDIDCKKDNNNNDQ